MYGSEREMWISVTEMHFKGAASCWYQSIESDLDSVTWEQFCTMVSERFDRDQHELLLRKLHHIKQTSSVSDYVTSFTTLVDQLTSYAKGQDPLYFITRFVDGLCLEIRAVLMVQRPKMLDAACTLALLQEEACGSCEVPRSGTSSYYKPSTLKNALLLLAPPPKLDKFTVQPTPQVTFASSSDAVSKLLALKQYRRALGLCYKCGAKWSKDHKCAPEVLHAVHDIWEAMSSDSEPEENLPEPQVP